MVLLSSIPIITLFSVGHLIILIISQLFNLKIDKIDQIISSFVLGFFALIIPLIWFGLSRNIELFINWNYIFAFIGLIVFLGLVVKWMKIVFIKLNKVDFNFEFNFYYLILIPIIIEN